MLEETVKMLWLILWEEDSSFYTHWFEQSKQTLAPCKLKQNKRTLFAVSLDSRKECVYSRRAPEATAPPSANQVAI